MEDMTQPDTSKYQNYTAPDGSRYKRDGESWVLQDPGIVEDTLRGGAAGLGTGVHKALTTPGTLGEMGLAGAQYVVGKDTPFGQDLQGLRDTYTYPSSYGGSKGLVDKAFPFTTYEPQHIPGNIAKTGADILPSAALGVAGEGALGAKFAPAAIRAGLSTAGGALGGGLTHDSLPLLEGPAEAVGMLTGMSGPATMRGLIKPKKGGVIESAKNWAGAVVPPLASTAAGAYLAPKFGQSPFMGGTEGLIAGLIGDRVMKASGDLAGAIGRAATPKFIPQAASAMAKALSKKNLYNAKGVDPTTAAALLMGEGGAAGQSVIGPP